MTSRRVELEGAADLLAGGPVPVEEARYDWLVLEWDVAPVADFTVWFDFGHVVEAERVEPAFPVNRVGIARQARLRAIELAPEDARAGRVTLVRSWEVDA